MQVSAQQMKTHLTDKTPKFIAEKHAFIVNVSHSLYRNTVLSPVSGVREFTAP